MESGLSASLLKRTDPSYSIIYNHCFGSTHKKFFAFSCIKFLLIFIFSLLTCFLRFFLTKNVGYIGIQGFLILQISMLTKTFIDYMKFGEYGNGFAQVMAINILITSLIAWLVWINFVILYLYFSIDDFKSITHWSDDLIIVMLVGVGFFASYSLYTSFLFYYVIAKRIKYLEYVNEKKNILLRHLTKGKEKELSISGI